MLGVYMLEAFFFPFWLLKLSLNFKCSVNYHRYLYVDQVDLELTELHPPSRPERRFEECTPHSVSW